MPGRDRPPRAISSPINYAYRCLLNIPTQFVFSMWTKLDVIRILSVSMFLLSYTTTRPTCMNPGIKYITPRTMLMLNYRKVVNLHLCTMELFAKLQLHETHGGAKWEFLYLKKNYSRYLDCYDAWQYIFPVCDASRPLITIRHNTFRP